MFGFKKKVSMDSEVDRVATILSTMKPDDPAYAEVAANLKTLCEARSYKNTSFSWDVVIGAITNITGIGLVVWREQTHSVVSKALAWIVKTRV